MGRLGKQVKVNKNRSGGESIAASCRYATFKQPAEHEVFLGILQTNRKTAEDAQSDAQRPLANNQIQLEHYTKNAICDVGEGMVGEWPVSDPRLQHASSIGLET
eukprot:1146193-Pelagomonas_calceolata.AAC.1